MERERILLSLATMGGAERHYIADAFDTGWVVPLGPNVDLFEKSLQEYLDTGHRVVALSSGTAAIHLALNQLGVTRGDDVVCQSFTFAASAFPIVYQCATPVFVDSEPDTWNMSPALLERAIVERKARTGRSPKAIIVVHLYGMPARMDEITAIAARHRIPIVEDAAEALGSEYGGRKCGTLGELGVLSFNGNKIITTSGGGALVCRTPEQALRTIFLATQARENRPYYHHESLGYNYRLSNISAGIGRGQMEVLPRLLARRREIHALYRTLFAGVRGIRVMENPAPGFDSNFWLTCITLEGDLPAGLNPESLRRHLEGAGIESRQLWKPLHLQPVFAHAPAFIDGTSEGLFARGLCLPSGAALTDDDITRVAHRIMELVK